MRKSKYNSFDELPLMLTVEDVSHVLGIGLAHAYEVAHRRDFPTITLGSRIIVPRDKFMEWIDEQAEKRPVPGSLPSHTAARLPDLPDPDLRGTDATGSYPWSSWFHG